MPDEANTAPGGPLVAMVKGYLDLDAARREDERYWRHVVVRHADNVERRLADILHLLQKKAYWAGYAWVAFFPLFVSALVLIIVSQRNQLAELRAVRELLAAQAAQATQGVCDVP